MKNLLTFGAFLLCSFSFGQIKALTEDGKEVVLFDNKTWRFTNETDEKQQNSIITNDNPFSKSEDATFLLRSSKIDAGIYINPKKWKTSSVKLGSLEYSFEFKKSQNSATMAGLSTDNVPIQTLKNLRDLVLANIQKSVDYFKLINSEYRTVNGNKVIFAEYAANRQGIDFHYVANFYLNENGFCNAIAFTYEKDFEKNKAELLSFINGLVKTDKSQDSEIIEVVKVEENPPPPMKIKKN